LIKPGRGYLFPISLQDSLSSYLKAVNMARLRPHSSPLGFFSFIGLIALMTLTVGALASPPSPSESSPSSSTAISPSSDDLICHTSNPEDCYPKIFVPTDHFQPVRPDQDLPPGLHVRLNVYTGEKEAKINVPDEPTPDSLAGLPVDSSVVVVEPNEPADHQDPLIRIPAGAPVYEPVGKIREPPKGDEKDAFFDSLEILKKGLGIDEALEELEELSHDIYYGLKIAEDYDTVKTLLCISTEHLPMSEQELGRARLAALTVSGALQNNAKALAEVEKHWEAFVGEGCEVREGREEEDIARRVYRLVSSFPGRGEARGDARVTKARVAALKGLLKSDVIRRDFLAKEGMRFVLDLLVSMDGEEWNSARERAAALVMDVFLDGEMGAKLGDWPVDDQLSQKECRDLTAQGVGVDHEKCWDMWAERLAREHRGDKRHWSQELWRRLKEARKGVKAQARWRDEL
jgi:nucleotide exchange factor SIL1